MQILTMEQGTPEWHSARLGLPTASEFSNIIADWEAAETEHDRWQRNRAIIAAINDGAQRKDLAEKYGITAQTVGAIFKKGAPETFHRPRAKMSATYMRKLAGERITGHPADESYTNAHMERGKTMEAEARSFYEFTTGTEVERVGLIKNHGAGASPDGLIGDDGLLEIKTALPHILIGYHEAATVPPEHGAQVMGQLWISERQWVDLLIYWPGMPPFQSRVQRNDTYIEKKLAPAVREFTDELEALVARLGRRAA